MDIGTFMRGNGNGTKNANGSNFEAAVLQRYAEASRKAEAGLCVPINYDRSLLEVIPQEIIEKDYGCGDPSRYIRAGRNGFGLGLRQRQGMLHHLPNRRRRGESHRRGL